MIIPFAGGSAAAAGELVGKQSGKVLEYIFVAEATSLAGRAKLSAPVYSIVKFD
jgi:adenine phosphoribosyltransferase